MRMYEHVTWQQSSEHVEGSQDESLPPNRILHVPRMNKYSLGAKQYFCQ